MQYNKKEVIHFELSEDQELQIKATIQKMIISTLSSFTEKYGLDDKYMKKYELARYLHLSNNTVNKLIKNGLPQISVQGTILYNKHQVDEWLKRHKTQE